MKNFVLFICSVLSICSCNSKKIMTDLEKSGLKGDIIFVLVEGYRNGIFGDPSIEFDENGNISREISYYEWENGEKLLFDNSFKRDSSNKIIAATESTYSNSYTSTYNKTLKYYSYKNDNLSTISYQNPSYDFLEKYKYEDDKLIEIKKEYRAKTNDGESSIETSSYFYNENNELDSIILVDISGNGHVRQRRTSTYGEKGLLKSEKTYYKWDKDEESSLVLIEYLYNSNKDLIERKYTDLKENKVTGVTRIKYVYDSHNNWIVRTSFDNDKKNKGKEEVTKRRIFYKGDNYSEYISKFDLFILKYKSSAIEFNDSSIQLQENSITPNLQDNDNQISNNTQQQEQRKCYNCNGSGKCEKCSRNFNKPYYKGNGSYEWRNETRPGLVMCNDCSGRGHQQKSRDSGGWEPSKDCYVSYCQEGWVTCSECNSNGSGSNLGLCKRCNGSGYDN